MDSADDDLTPFAVRLDEPTTPQPPHPPAETPEPPRLSLLSREVAPRDFQPRLWADR